MQSQDPAQRDPASSQIPGDANTNAPEIAGASDTTSAQPAAQPSELSVEERLAAAEQEVAALKDQWLRGKADMDNLRKRNQEDISKAHKYGVENLASALLPIKDSLEATLAAENATLDVLRSGVELTLKQLAGIFEKSRLQEINPVGAKFDPHFHQAISVLPADQEPNTVITVLQKGYVLHDRVIRPALVTVAKPKDA